MTRAANSASLYLRSSNLYGAFETILSDGRRAPLPDIFDFGVTDLTDYTQLATAARDMLIRSATHVSDDSSWDTPLAYDNSARAHGYKNSSAFLSEAQQVWLHRDGENIVIYATKRKGKRNPGFLFTKKFVAKQDETEELGAAIKFAFEEFS